MARRRRTRRGSLKDLIDAGLLEVDEELTSEPRKGERYTSTLAADGSIIYEGKSFPNPSNWVLHVAGNPRNGWDFVTVREQKLDFYRKQFEDGIEPPQENQPAIVKPEPVQDVPQNYTRPADAESLQSEVNTLKAQLVSQQSEIASLNMKIDSLPISPPEDDMEDDIIRYLRERVLKLEPSEFEKLVGEYLKSKGFMNVVVNGRSGDGGIDGECGIPFINIKVAFQAKRYTTANSIGIDPVQRLQGSMTGKFDRGIFITTSNYTPAARGWVEEAQAQITLINGDELMKEMVDLGLGVKAVTVVKHEVDEDFFADL
jgi:restriction endonuclease Mrr